MNQSDSKLELIKWLIKTNDAILINTLIAIKEENCQTDDCKVLHQNQVNFYAANQHLAAHHIGNGIPTDSNGFQISDLDTVANDFKITAGRCLVGGCEVVLTVDTTYKTQPHKGNLSALPTGLSNVYLRVFQSEFTGTHDPGLNNADEGDVGFETTVRQKIEWEVLVTKSAINFPDHLLLAVINKGSSSIEDRRRTGLTLSSICDEISLARGDRNRLDERLDESLRGDGKLKQDSVGSIQIADNAVNSGKIAGNAVTSVKIADNAVTSAKIQDSSVTSNKIANNAAVTAKIANSAVTSVKIANNAVTQNKIAKNSVTIEKLRAPRITGEKSIPSNGSVSVNLGATNRNEHAFYLISVSLVNIPNTSGRIEWSRRILPVSTTQLRQVLFIDNKWPLPVTVSWKVLRIL
jgi:hypothetical protein